MIWIMAPVAALLGYLLGAIPVGVLACRLYGVDIRQVGSGRTGATNAWRAAGLKAAIPTVIGDAVKGAVAIWLVTLLTRGLFPEPTTMSVSEAVSRANALPPGAVVGYSWRLRHRRAHLVGFPGL